MTESELRAAFSSQESDDEFLAFDHIPPDRRLSTRPDLHALILLDKLVSGNSDIIDGAEHDEYFLSIDPCDVAEVATVEIVLDLSRCGVRLGMTDGFAFYA